MCILIKSCLGRYRRRDKMGCELDWKELYRRGNPEKRLVLGAQPDIWCYTHDHHHYQHHFSSALALWNFCGTAFFNWCNSNRPTAAWRARKTSRLAFRVSREFELSQWVSFFLFFSFLPDIDPSFSSRRKHCRGESTPGTHQTLPRNSFTAWNYASP